MFAHQTYEVVHYAELSAVHYFMKYMHINTQTECDLF